MKNSLALFVLALLFVQNASAQSPQSIPFQAVARDTNGVLIANQNISLRITIHSGASIGPVVYKEIQSVTTNNLGLLTLSIGKGTVVSGNFSTINWGGATMYVQLEDSIASSGYTSLGTSQLQSVPYALYALNSSTGYWAQGSSNLIPNDTTKNVGIGTAYPTTKLGVNGTTMIKATGPGSPYDYGSLQIDSGGLAAFTSNVSSMTISMLLVGNYDNLIHLGVGALGLLNEDLSQSINYGFLAIADSTIMITSNGAHTQYGAFGTHDTSAYIDVQTTAGLNSLTEDSDGLHWEYHGTEIGSFPKADGAVNTVLTTDGAGNWSWHTVTGTTGATGATGAVGATGSAGSNGSNGATGATGSAGTNGTTGATGATGVTGATGIAGTTGSNGSTGANGATGANGSQGVTGATGVLSSGSAAGNTPYWNGSAWVTNSSNIYNNGGNIGIGTLTPNSTLQDSGSVSFKLTTHTANYTVAATDVFVVCTTNSFTVTLPTAVGITGRMYVIKNGTSGKTITLATTSSQTIDGSAPGTISGIGVMRLVSNGANWWTW